MKNREKIFKFINESIEWKIYNKRKKMISIISSFVSLFSVIILILSFFFNQEISNYLLITSLTLILINLLFIIISIQIFIKFFMKNIYKNVNKNIKKILEIKGDIEININSKIENYNYKKTLITLVTDDIDLKIEKIINGS